MSEEKNFKIQQTLVLLFAIAIYCPDLVTDVVRNVMMITTDKPYCCINNRMQWRHFRPQWPTGRHRRQQDRNKLQVS